jgi:acetylornithine deacetylase/succinyl-diaminopimelate desuccinylase-like protein
MAVAEKTYKSFRLSTHGTGGHSSVPPTEGDPVLRLARALVRVGEHRFPAHVIPEARDMLAAAARGEKPPLSDALANSARTGKLTPADEKLITAERIYNAAIRTTCVVTQLEGAPADNVLPTSPWAAVNCRILPDETVDQTEARLREAIGDPGVEIARMDDLGPGGKVPLVGPVPDAVHAAARKLWGDVPVVNSIQYGASDSRYLREAGIHSYGIDTAPTSLDEIRSGHSAHGANERAPVKWLPAGTDFLREVVRELVK